MIRLAISVEGETEEEFVKNVLAENLRAKGVEPYPSLLKGDVTVEKLASDMAKLVWSFDFVTSLVDFYGFRGKGSATVEELEERIGEEVDRQIGRNWNQSQLIPYVQRHEFEGLLFSDVSAFGGLIYASEDAVAELQMVRSRFPTPEDVNDSSETAPSKRIELAIPRYKKRVAGSQIAMAIGLPVIRDQCPRFNRWLTSLESLGTVGTDSP